MWDGLGHESTYKGVMKMKWDDMTCHYKLLCITRVCTATQQVFSFTPPYLYADGGEYVGRNAEGEEGDGA